MTIKLNLIWSNLKAVVWIASKTGLVVDENVWWTHTLLWAAQELSDVQTQMCETVDMQDSMHLFFIHPNQWETECTCTSTTPHPHSSFSMITSINAPRLPLSSDSVRRQEEEEYGQNGRRGRSQGTFPVWMESRLCCGQQCSYGGILIESRLCCGQ